MTIQGIGSDLYYINNPIWIKLTEINPAVKYIEVRLTNVTDGLNPSQPMRLYNNGTELTYDLQELIKGNFPKPSYRTAVQGEIGSTLHYYTIEGNYKKFNINFREVYANSLLTGSNLNITKTFIRGGSRSQLTNVTASNPLRESAKFPVWGGFPYVYSYIQPLTKKIAYTQSVLDQSEIERMRIPSGCDPLYVRFLNTKGSYSFWLFEKYTEKDTAKSLDYLEGTKRNERTDRISSHDYNHLGMEVEFSLTAETRVKEDYYNTIRALLVSPEVHIYNKFGNGWVRVIMGDNDFSRKNVERMQKVSIDFDVPSTNNPAVIW